MSERPYYGLAATQNATMVVHGGGMFSTSDGGATWKKIGTPIAPRWVFVDLHDHIWISGDGGEEYVSKDGGATWEKAKLPKLAEEAIEEW